MYIPSRKYSSITKFYVKATARDFSGKLEKKVGCARRGEKTNAMIELWAFRRRKNNNKISVETIFTFFSSISVLCGCSF